VTLCVSRLTFKVMVDAMLCTSPVDEATGEDRSAWFIENTSFAMSEFVIGSALNPFHHRMYWKKGVRRAHKIIQEYMAFSEDLLNRFRRDPEKESNPKKASSLIAMLDKCVPPHSVTPSRTFQTASRPYVQPTQRLTNPWLVVQGPVPFRQGK
jgi:hypothetical protein